MEFETLDEAISAQVLCGTCGRPKKALQGVHNSDGTRYQLVRCKEFRCRVHCSKTNGCGHVRSVEGMKALSTGDIL